MALLLALVCPPATALDWHTELPFAQPIGQGEFRWFGFHIYTATLWSGHKPFDESTPFALELTYHCHISRDRFVQSSMDEIRRIFGQRFSADKLRGWEALLSQAFPDVNDGDQLIGIFIPHQGCRFYDKNGLRVSIDDPEFARAFFAIWLDPHTRDNRLREQLLGLNP